MSYELNEEGTGQAADGDRDQEIKSSELGAELDNLTDPLGSASALLDAVGGISRQLEVQSVAEEAARQIVHFTRAEACFISKWDQVRQGVEMWARHSQEGQDKEEKLLDFYPIEDYPLTEEILRKGKVEQILVDDSKADQAERRWMNKFGAKTLLLLPLKAFDRTIGLIELIDFSESKPFGKVDVEMAQLLASHAGIAIERAEALSRVHQRAAELEALRQVGLILTSSLELTEVLYAVLQATLDLAPDAMDAHIFLYENEKLIRGTALYSDGGRGVVFSEPRENGLTYTVARDAKIIAIEDMTKNTMFKNFRENAVGWTGAIVGFPLHIGDRVVGVMNVAYKKTHKFSNDELQVFKMLGDQAAVAIENASLHDLVSIQANTDQLTGLPNRRSFEDRLEEETLRSNRYQREFALVMLDLNDFKQVNDTYGHPVGDETLVIVGNCMLNKIRDTDFLARIGGDEFALILPETTVEEAKVICTKLVNSIKNCDFPWKSGGIQVVNLDAETGIAGYPSQAKTKEELIILADNTLYNFKKDPRK